MELDNQYLEIIAHAATYNIDNDFDPDIAVACGIGNNNMVKKLINGLTKASINAVNNIGYSYLHFACKYEHHDTAKMLIELGCDVNIKGNNTSLSCLQIAIMNNDIQIGKLLINNGIDLNYKYFIDDMSYLHFSVAHNKQLFIKLLLDSNISVNRKDKNGKTCLHFASKCKVYHDNIIIAKTLMNYGANILAKDNDGKTSFDIAKQYHNHTITKLLKKGYTKRLYILSLIVQYDVLKYHIIKKIDILS